MIYYVNLSKPRKGIKKLYDDCMFTIKYNNIKLDKIAKTAGAASAILILNNQSCYAESVVCENNCSIDNIIVNYLGYPGVDYIFQLLRVRKELFNYAVVNMKSAIAKHKKLKE